MPALSLDASHNSQLAAQIMNSLSPSSSSQKQQFHQQQLAGRSLHSRQARSSSTKVKPIYEQGGSGVDIVQLLGGTDTAADLRFLRKGLIPASASGQLHNE